MSMPTSGLRAPLSNDETTEMLAKICSGSRFRPLPTMARDEYGGKKCELGSCGIVNIDRSDGPGTHFVCFINTPDYPHVIYFDSYGADPPKLIDKFLKTSGKQCAYNSSHYQPIKSSLCGYYCLKVLKDIVNGKSFYDAIADFGSDHEENDRLITQLFT